MVQSRASEKIKIGSNCCWSRMNPMQCNAIQCKPNCCKEFRPRSRERHPFVHVIFDILSCSVCVGLHSFHHNLIFGLCKYLCASDSSPSRSCSLTFLLYAVSKCFLLEITGYYRYQSASAFSARFYFVFLHRMWVANSNVPVPSAKSQEDQNDFRPDWRFESKCSS